MHGTVHHREYVSVARDRQRGAHQVDVDVRKTAPGHIDATDRRAHVSRHHGQSRQVRAQNPTSLFIPGHRNLESSSMCCNGGLAANRRFQVVRRLLAEGHVLLCSTSTRVDRPLLPLILRGVSMSKELESLQKLHVQKIKAWVTSHLSAHIFIVILLS